MLRGQFKTSRCLFSRHCLGGQLLWGIFFFFFSLSDLLDRCSLYNSYFFCSYAPSVHFLCALASCIFFLSMKFITYQKKKVFKFRGRFKCSY